MPGCGLPHHLPGRENPYRKTAVFLIGEMRFPYWKVVISFKDLRQILEGNRMTPYRKTGKTSAEVFMRAAIQTAGSRFIPG